MAQREGMRLAVSGCDISPTAIEFARERADNAKVPIHLFRFNVLSDEWPTDYDIIVNSLFLHHLTTDSVTEVLARMAVSNATSCAGQRPGPVSPGISACTVCRSTFVAFPDRSLRRPDLGEGGIYDVRA